MPADGSQFPPHEKGHGPDPLDVAAGARVRLRRRDRGVSQERLAEAIGVSFQQVQKYERGTNRISLSMLVRIATYLETPAAWFIGETEGAPEVPLAAADIINTFQGVRLIELAGRLSGERLAALIRIAEALQAEVTP